MFQVAGPYKVLYPYRGIHIHGEKMVNPCIAENTGNFV